MGRPRPLRWRLPPSARRPSLPHLSCSLDQLPARAPPIRSHAPMVSACSPAAARPGLGLPSLPPFPRHMATTRLFSLPALGKPCLPRRPTAPSPSSRPPPPVTSFPPQAPQPGAACQARPRLLPLPQPSAATGCRRDEPRWRLLSSLAHPPRRAVAALLASPGGGEALETPVTTSQPGGEPPRGSLPRSWVLLLLLLLVGLRGCLSPQTWWWRRSKSSGGLANLPHFKMGRGGGGEGEWKAGNSRRDSNWEQKRSQAGPRFPPKTMKGTRQVSLLPNLQPTMGRGVGMEGERLRPRSPSFLRPPAPTGGDGRASLEISNGRETWWLGGGRRGGPARAPHGGAPNCTLARGRAAHTARSPHAAGEAGLRSKAAQKQQAAPRVLRSGGGRGGKEGKRARGIQSYD